MEQLKSLFAGVDMDRVTTVYIGRNSELDVLVMTDRPGRHFVDAWDDITKYACWKVVMLAAMLRQTNEQVRFDCFGVIAWVNNSPQADMFATMVRGIIGSPLDPGDETIH
jgi:hypothetical protein